MSVSILCDNCGKQINEALHGYWTLSWAGDVAPNGMEFEGVDEKHYCNDCIRSGDIDPLKKRGVLRQ